MSFKKKFWPGSEAKSIKEIVLGKSTGGEGFETKSKRRCGSLTMEK